jgi:uncharacterized protein YecE (DUF72 family)
VSHVPAPDVRIGVISWTFPEWRGTLYEKGAKPADFLAQYARRFRIVEAAGSHYGLPKRETIARWAESVPEGFSISVKVTDWVLEKKAGDPDLPKGLGVFVDHLSPLRDAGKLGTLVAQFPPRFHYDRNAEDLRAFVAAMPAAGGSDLRWAVELRHESWWREETYALLRDAGVTLVWSELADGFRTPPVATTHSLYLRLFGDRALEEPWDRKKRDATGTLALWAERIRAAPPSVRRADVLVSKFLEGHPAETAKTIAGMLGVPLEPPAPKRGQTTLSFE